MSSEPICGNCLKPLSEHYHEREIFCFTHTSGDIYRTEPREDLILDKMAERYPDLYQKLVDEWKLKHGHKTTDYHPRSGMVKRLVDNFTRFLRRNLQCRFNVHWVSVVNIGNAHDCPDCGKHYPAIKWPRC